MGPSCIRGVRRTLIASSVLVALAAVEQNAVVAQETSVEEVIVTGSRIARRDYEAQTPIVTLDADAFTERTNIGLEGGSRSSPAAPPPCTAPTRSRASSTSS